VPMLQGHWYSVVKKAPRIGATNPKNKLNRRKNANFRWSTTKWWS
jgi:hypothetical protein